MRLLVVEDEPQIAKALKKGLEQESFVVDLAFDGQTGFDLAAAENYDLIILDLMLPKLTGEQICAKLRQEEKITTPILMLTAKGATKDKITGLNLGADDYLPKPFDFEELLARIRALLRRPRVLAPEKLVYQDLSLDPVNFEVTRGQKPLRLSKKEFALLAYLLQNAGKIITKEAIIQHVWNFDADILPNTVEVYIGYLRKKVDQPFPHASPLIQTVRGFGYQLTNKNV